MRYLENKDVVLIYEVHEPVLPQFSIPLRVSKCCIETDTAKACLRSCGGIAITRSTSSFCAAAINRMLVEDLSVLAPLINDPRG